MKTLLIISFETSDGRCPYYEVPVIISANNFNYATLEDGFMSYLDSDMSEDAEYEDMVEDVLNASGYKWRFINGKMPKCDDYKIIYI